MSDTAELFSNVYEACEEIDRLTAVLHARQAHPDYEYCVTAGWDPIGEGWEPNPSVFDGLNGAVNADQYRAQHQPRQTYLMRRRVVTS